MPSTHPVSASFESRRRAFWPPVLGALAAITSACSGDDAVVITPPDNATEAPPDGDEPEVPTVNDEPVYVVFSTIDNPGGRNSYYATTPSIEGDVAVDMAQGLELPGHSHLYAPREGGYILSGGGESPTLTRYELADSGILQQGATLSFAQLGVTDSRSQVLFYSSSKAYFLDYTQLQIISFDPTAMTIIDVLPLEDFRCQEMQTRFGFAIRRDDGYYFTRSCLDVDVTSSGSSLVHLDPVTDTVTVTHDSRCMGMRVGFLADRREEGQDLLRRTPAPRLGRIRAKGVTEPREADDALSLRVEPEDGVRARAASSCQTCPKASVWG